MNFYRYLLLLVLVCSMPLLNTATSKTSPTEVTIGNKIFQVTVVCDDKDRIQGLSGEKSLGENEGMLFIFERSERHSIWMKDMNFSIDIIWLDPFRSINHIEREVSPASYPNVLTPSYPALYVLEIPAGSAENIELKTATSFTRIPARCAQLR